LSAADRFIASPADDEMQTLVDNMGMQPLFM
jgi:hypothetical protein